MNQKKMVPFINAENEYPDTVIALAQKYANEGADEIFLYNYTGDEASKEEFLSAVRTIDKAIDIPFLVGMYVQCFEDAKKALYTGASGIVIRKALLPGEDVIKDITARFDKEKLAIEVDMKADFQEVHQLDAFYQHGFGKVVVKHIDTTQNYKDVIENTQLSVLIRDGLIRNDLAELMSFRNVEGVSTNYFEDKDIYKAKRSLKKQGVSVEVLESAIDFSDFKLNEDGLIPAIVQDYRTGEILMLGYMNEESFQKTLECGKMTYFSRSRQQLWLKGETSGHFQYVKSLALDCDNDTILAKVYQVGAACHTGNRSCFYKELAKKETVTKNPLHILQEDYEVIRQRKEQPKEGSYTNYLFQKGVDKILKKCGEEATEMVIAAKNPDREELKYEMADFLYHMMVLMVECGLDWDDLTKELANRQ